MGSLNKGYASLFGLTDDTGEEEPKETIKGGFAEYWAWHLVLDNLSNHDRTKWEFFYNMNVIEFLNCISFYRDKQKWEYDAKK